MTPTLDGGDLASLTALAAPAVEDDLHVLLAAEGMGERVVSLRLLA